MAEQDLREANRHLEATLPHSNHGQLAHVSPKAVLGISHQLGVPPGGLICSSARAGGCEEVPAVSPEPKVEPFDCPTGNCGISRLTFK